MQMTIKAKSFSVVTQSSTYFQIHCALHPYPYKNLKLRERIPEGKRPHSIGEKLGTIFAIVFEKCFWCVKANMVALRQFRS